MKIFSFTTFLLIFCSLSVGCSDSSTHSDANSLENNTLWPVEVTGTIDIVEAGFGNSDYMSWAVGSIQTDSIYGELSIYLESNAAIDAQVDLDEAGKFKVWLGPPRTEYGHIEYEIIQIEKL